MKFLLGLLLLGPVGAMALAPEWFSDLKTYPGCERELLCAAGTGETLADALNEARSEVAKFFQSNIKSKSFVSSSSEQKGATAASGTFDEWTNKTVSVETSELISGLEISKQVTVDGHVYVLMTLERAKTAGLLKDKILELDTEDSQLLGLNSRFAYPKLQKNLAAIEIYNNRYTLLSDNKIVLKVNKETLQDKINKLAPMKMALVSRGKQIPARLNHTLIELLAPLKVVVVSTKQTPTHLLRGEIVTEEQYFKVDGFKKLNVVYKLELLDANKTVIGKMSAFSEQVARSSEHAIEKAIPEIKEALQDHLDQLSSK